MSNIELQYNQTTGTPYEGRNQAILMGAKERFNYQSNSWITFIQAKNNGLQLVNARGCGIHLIKFVTDIDREGHEVTKPFHFVVFNMDLTKSVK